VSRTLSQRPGLVGSAGSAGAVPALRFDRREMAGAVADLGVLVPIAVALIVQNGLSATAVLLPAGMLYLVVGLYYRVPVSVQPLKAFGAVAIAQGLGVDAIAAGALLMGAVFVLLGTTGLLDRAASLFPRAVVRGVQLSVGLLFLRLCWGLVTSPPAAFRDADAAPLWLVGATVVAVVLALLLRRRAVTLLLVLAAAAVAVASYEGAWRLGPSPLIVPSLDAATFAVAAVVLVLPQLPLTFANSCLAAADVARTYYGDGACRVSPGRLGTTLGVANLAVGAVGGMPLCHGAGGMTAHRAFGARTGGAPLVLGGVLVLLALVAGAVMGALLTGFPLPILAALLAVAGVLHLGLLRDLDRPFEWVVALGIGAGGFTGHLGLALLGGMLVWWTTRWLAPRLTAPARP
jgi:hypothetical protein